MSLNSHLFPRCPMRRYVACLLLGCRSDPIAPSDHTKAHHRHLGRCQGPRRRVDVLVAPRRPGGVPWCCLGVPPVWVFDRGSRGSHAEPCSPAAASGRPVAHQVCPAVLMTPFGGVFRAVRSTEHDVEPVPIIFHRWRLTRRRGGRAWDRRVRPLRRAGAAPDFPRRRCTILEVPGEFRRTGGHVGRTYAVLTCARHQQEPGEITPNPPPVHPFHLRSYSPGVYIGVWTPLRAPEVLRQAGGRSKITPARSTLDFRVLSRSWIWVVCHFE